MDMTNYTAPIASAGVGTEEGNPVMAPAIQNTTQRVGELPTITNLSNIAALLTKLANDIQLVNSQVRVINDAALRIWAPSSVFRLMVLNLFNLI